MKFFLWGKENFLEKVFLSPHPYPFKNFDWYGDRNKMHKMTLNTTLSDTYDILIVKFETQPLTARKVPINFVCN